MLLNLSINNNSLVAYHSTLVDDKNKTNLNADYLAGVTAITVSNISGFLVGQYVLLGNFGEPNAEIIRLHAATAPTGNTITLASATLNDHYTDTPVTILDFNQVEFSIAATVGGSKTVLNTYGIQANRINTIYIDLTNTTGYGFFRFKNSGTTTYSAYSAAVNYTGNDDTSLESIIKEGCRMAGVEYGSDYAKETDTLKDANDALDRVQERGDWTFELVNNDTTISASTNENAYSLSSLTAQLKYVASAQSILDVRLGNATLKQITVNDMDRVYDNVAKTTTSATINIGDTSITLTDSNEFRESGALYVGPVSGASYTANNQSTGVLSGFSASTFASIIASGANVFQGIAPGLPTRYSIFNNTISFDVPVSSTYAGQKIKLKYLKRLARFTSFASTTEIPFYSALSIYIASKISARKQMADDQQRFLAEFFSYVDANLDRYKLPVLDTYVYYNFYPKPTQGFSD